MATKAFFDCSCNFPDAGLVKAGNFFASIIEEVSMSQSVSGCQCGKAFSNLFDFACSLLKLQRQGLNADHAVCYRNQTLSVFTY